MTAIILGGGLNGLWIARSLGRKSIPVHLIDQREDDIAYHSRYVNAVKLSNKHDIDEIYEKIKVIAAAAPSVPTLFCTGDHWIMQAADLQKRLKGKVHSVIPSKKSVINVVNKKAFQYFVSQGDFATPQTWTPALTGTLDFSEFENATFPLIIKPYYSLDWQRPAFIKQYGYCKAIRADCPEQLQEYWSALSKLGSPLLVQEYLVGGDDEHYSFVSYRNRDNQELLSATIKKQRVLPIHHGAATFAEINDDPEQLIASKARKILNALDYPGVSSVCFKRDGKTGESKIYEINGRFPLGHSALQMGGIDLPWLMYQDSNGVSFERPSITRPKGKWAALSDDIDAFRDYYKVGELGLLQWLASYAQIKMIAEWAADDLRPFGYFLRQAFARLLKKSKCRPD
tara:strand:+ start:50 stop:1246 length:1197 start_codon:yes stop_codon:yes gene_type:complete